MTRQANLSDIVLAVNKTESANSALLPQVSTVRRVCQFDGSSFHAVLGTRFGAVTAFAFHAAVEALPDGGIIVHAAGSASGAEALCYTLCDLRRDAVAALNVEAV